MAPTTEENRRRWMRRFRRKENLSQDVSAFNLTERREEMCQTRMSAPEEGDRSRRRPGTSKLKRSKTEIDFSRERRDVLPARVENKIYALAETSCNMKKMTVELDTHQKCVTNLAATVVRQNNQIRELKRHIRELTAQLQGREDDSSSTSVSDASEDPPNPLETSASGSEISSLYATSSKENDCRQATAPDSIMAAAAALNAVLDEARDAMKPRSNEKDRSRGTPLRRKSKGKSAAAAAASSQRPKKKKGVLTTASKQHQ